MITEAELKELNNKFDKLGIASKMKCPDCVGYIKLYLSTVYLHNSGVLPIEDNHFLNALLSELETHIRTDHRDRAKYFLKD